MATTDGLDDIVAAHSAICELDGKQGRLLYYGVDIHDLARSSSFEETAYLLWHGVLPTRAQLEAVTYHLQANRPLPSPIVHLMRLLPKTSSPMDVLRTAVSALSSFDPDAGDNSRVANVRRSIHLTAVFPTIVAAWDRMRNGKELVEPLAGENHATNFLYILNGEMPHQYKAHVLDTPPNLPPDHEFDPSTFPAPGT